MSVNLVLRLSASLGGQDFPLNIPVTSTVRELKEHIEDHISGTDLRFVHAGRIWEADKPLTTYSLVDESIVHVIPSATASSASPSLTASPSALSLGSANASTGTPSLTAPPSAVNLGSGADSLGLQRDMRRESRLGETSTEEHRMFKIFLAAHIPVPANPRAATSWLQGLIGDVVLRNKVDGCRISGRTIKITMSATTEEFSRLRDTWQAIGRIDLLTASQTVAQAAIDTSFRNSIEERKRSVGNIDATQDVLNRILTLHGAEGSGKKRRRLARSSARCLETAQRVASSGLRENKREESSSSDEA